MNKPAMEGRIMAEILSIRTDVNDLRGQIAGKLSATQLADMCWTKMMDSADSPVKINYAGWTYYADWIWRISVTIWVLIMSMKVHL